MLDEVTDVRVTADDCANIKFNPMFGEYEVVRDYCLLFLRNSISMSYKDDLKLFAFLLPMEYVFEDFIFGFIDKEIATISVSAQSNSTYLDKDKSFLLRPDLILEINGHSIIADTKYKIVYADGSDNKGGVLQSDLYQILAYAVRFKVNDAILLYPNTMSGNSINSVDNEIIIIDELASKAELRIKVCRLPIINKNLIRQGMFSEEPLEEIFEQTKAELKERLEYLLKPLLKLS